MPPKDYYFECEKCEHNFKVNEMDTMAKCPACNSYQKLHPEEITPTEAQ